MAKRPTSMWSMTENKRTVQKYMAGFRTTDREAVLAMEASRDQRSR